MTSIDDLFRKPNAPGKRKLESPSSLDPTELYSKSAKLSNGSSPHSNGKHTTVEDEPNLDDVDAGPELPPEEDVPDDDEGRFFGGGVTQGTRDALDYIEGREDAEEDAEEVVDTAWLRKMALNFEKRLSKNAEMRAKYEGSPERFMASEADLDAEIKALSILAEHAELYPEFVKIGCVGSLVSLLAHENTDIAIDAIEVLGELTDDDVEVEASHWTSLVDAMVEADVIDLLTQNLARLDEKVENDRNGVYQILNVVENLLSQGDMSNRVGQKSTLLAWLLKRVQEKGSRVTQNTQYAAELLAILLQSSEANRRSFSDAGGIDVALQLLSAYRKRDPEKDSDEEEYVENLFDCLTCVVDEDFGKEKLLEAEGVELCLIMLREGKISKARALRVLDHALGGQSGMTVCERFVEAVGLKTIFSMFMKKQERETMEHIIGIFSSLLRLLPGGSASRIRTLAKFVEKDYEKINKLVEVRAQHAERVQRVEVQIRQEEAAMESEEKEERTAESLSRRLDAGLFSLQTIDVVLAWLAAEDGGAMSRIQELLIQAGEGLEVLKQSLQEQLDGIETEGDPGVKDMLQALLACL